MEKHKKKMPHDAQGQNLWLTSLIGGGIGLAVTLLTALLMPLVLLNMDDPNSFVLPAAGVCAFAGGAVSGVISARSAKGKELISGLISAAVILVPMLLVSFMFKKGFDMLGFAVIAASLIAASVLGALAISKIEGSKKRSMKRAMKRR